VLFLSFAALSAERGEDASSHWLFQIKHLEHLNVECPEAILRMAQHVGNVTLGGRVVTPKAAERAAGEMALLSFLAVTGLDERGELIAEGTLRGMGELLATSPYDPRMGHWGAVHHPTLQEAWGRVSTQLSRDHKARTWTELGGQTVSCSVSLEKGDFPPPGVDETPGGYYHRNRELLDALGVDAGSVEGALAEANPAAEATKTTPEPPLEPIIEPTAVPSL